MQTATTLARRAVGLTGVAQVVLGLAFWTDRALQLVPLHMAIGLAFILALWTLAALAARAGVSRPQWLLVVAWGGLVLAFGVLQGRLLPGPAHWVVEAAHLGIGIVAMALAARLTARIRAVTGGTPTPARDLQSSARAAGDAPTTRWALATLGLTSVHHAYGAWVYGTPWRYHVVLVALATTAVMLAALRVLRSRPAGVAGDVARWTFALATLAVPVVLIGAFEGLYNHVVKDVLWLGGASPELMTRLFPPPRYELPNDAIFESTGVLQVVPAAATAWHLLRMRRLRPTGVPSYAAGD